MLPNGAAILADPDRAARSVALGLFWDVGSRDERRSEWGAAHFLEHLVFKGAGRWDREAIAREMDRLGGEINAFTTRDLTCYHAHLLDRDLLSGFELLWTLVTDPWLREEDVAIEQQVVREELRDALDDPEDRAEQAYLAGLWGTHPLAREVLGSPESLARLQAATLRAFYRAWYRPEALTVVVTGRVAPSALRAIRERVAAFPPGAPARPRTAGPVPVGGETLARVPGDQAHVLVGWPAPAWDDPRSVVARLLAVAFGGQNSSRLWQRVREQEGLAYHVGASYTAYRDCADVSLGASVGVSHLARVIEVMGDEWGDLRRRPLSADEVARAQRQLETALVFGLETPEGRMHWLARWAMARRSPPDIATVLAEIRGVTPNAVNALVEDLTAQRAASVVAVAGPRRALTHGLRTLFWEAAGWPAVTASGVTPGVEGPTLSHHLAPEEDR